MDENTQAQRSDNYNSNLELEFQTGIWTRISRLKSLLNELSSFINADYI